MLHDKQRYLRLQEAQLEEKDLKRWRKMQKGQMIELMNWENGRTTKMEPTNKTFQVI